MNSPGSGLPPRTLRRPIRLDNLSLRDQRGMDRLPRRLAQMMVGLTGFGLSLAMLLRSGLGGAVYIGAQLGAGARDGLMTGLGRVLSRSVGPVRIVLEVIVLVTGWLLGGPLGLGTVVYAIALGPVIQLTLPHVLVPVRTVRGRPLDPPA